MLSLYLDEDVHKRVAISLRLKGYDVVSAYELQKWGLDDEEQLEFAISQKKAIFTFNVRHFIKLHLKYTKTNKRHYGIIVSKQLSLSETVVKLSNFLFKKTREDIINQLFWL
ncbi:MAG: DUF5615 family PIN-like protein [bacterium]|nr:DUF5615 family PIN-like protein [bacterium]